ncbi:NAD(+) diphosphatase [Roseibaca sp. Y0-43]|uniref:NAD(+) diphosphatase n=1 Tax=Roseibaca sp. Y0-43 TaxID=2816854 RepID=UPI001D0C0BB6|nr:NAD(+) diphosphatase [Roseibaca sp. Y0-43]MCC1481742.1 NAD(+) diphosphatase [Roseibaca sp. Y0-43]
MIRLEMAFSGAWDDRAAHERAESHALRRGSAVLPLWRGKTQIGPDGLAWVAPEDDALRHAGATWLYLGRHGGQARFAADISTWEPDGLDTAALAMFADPSEQHYPGAADDTRFAELRLAMTSLTPAEAALAATARAVFNWHRSHRFCAACGQESQIAMGGWERHCPACGAKHFPRTDPVVIMLVARGNKLLLGRSHGWPEGMYSALAGFVEPGETPEAAVAREVREETGITVQDIRFLGAQPWPFPNSLMLGYLAQATDDQITLDDELEDALWITREDLLAVLSGERSHPKPARKGSIAHAMIRHWLAGHV